MKKLLTIIVAIMPLAALAQSMNVSVDSVGMLAKELPDSVRFKVAELKVTGPLNGADLKLLSQIVTRTKTNKKVADECLVKSIDLSEAVITEGKEGMKTENNTLTTSLFSGAKSLEKAILPQNILNISRNCFDNCTSLREVIIPDGVVTIGSDAFSDCTALSSIHLPKSLTKIEHDAFEQCTSLTEIVIPENVIEIGNNTFTGCKSLAKVVFNGNNIRAFSPGVFMECESLSEISVPESVKSLGNNVFRGCTALGSISLDDDLTEIGNSAFEDCTSLASIGISKVEKIGSNAFDILSIASFRLLKAFVSIIRSHAPL